MACGFLIYFFVPCFLSSLPLQTDHFTESKEELGGKKMASNVRVYPINKSFVEDKHCRSFLNVWNQHTPQYSDKIQKLMSKIPFQDLLDSHLAAVLSGSAKVNKRGNYQTSYGFCGGISLQPRTAGNIEKHFGAAVPNLRIGTETFIPILRVLSLLAREVDMKCADRDFLALNPADAEEIEFVKEEIDRRVCLALATPCFGCLDTISRVKRHQDTENGINNLGEVMTVSKICKAGTTGK